MVTTEGMTAGTQEQNFLKPTSPSFSLPVSLCPWQAVNLCWL